MCKDAYLMTLVTYVNEDKIQEDLLYCKEIRRASKAANLCDISDNFVNTNVLGVFTEGARSSGIHRQVITSEVSIQTLQKSFNDRHKCHPRHNY
jgi:hypothetical protein